MYTKNLFTNTIGFAKSVQSGISRGVRRLLSLIVLIAFVALWQLIVWLKLYPPFVIPAPNSVLDKAVTVINNGTLWIHTSATLSNVLIGLCIGLLFGMSLGYCLAKSQLLEAVLSPFVVAIQSTPVVAYAPLLIIWFGSGPSGKIVTCVLIVFFPILINTIVGIQNVPSGLRDVMRTMRASRWQTFIKLEIPAAMPILLSGLKVSATLAVIGAVVGEFISANVGLGFLVNLARSQYDTSLVIVSVITLTIMARTLFFFASTLERWLLMWQLRARRN